MNFVLIPAHNEEKNIKNVLQGLREYSDLGVVVIDDGSTDKTSVIAEKLGVVILKHEKCKGKGEAIKTGMDYVIGQHPKVKHIALMDADGQYIPEELENLITMIKDDSADIVTGCRNWKTIPYRHRMGNFVWRTFFNILFGKNFKDTNCGFMIMNKKATKKIMKVLHGGYIIENTIFIEAVRNKLKIRQTPVTVIYKKRSNVSRGIRVVMGVLLFIFLEGLKYRLGIKY
jgi:glycosyltransferase involved in cell wall biosynthesis